MLPPEPNAECNYTANRNGTQMNTDTDADEHRLRISAEALSAVLRKDRQGARRAQRSAVRV
jgi:hypothetical protein